MKNNKDIVNIDKSKIPIVVMNYNRIECLYLTIYSLINNIDPNRYQIVIWDDCSTDNRIQKWLKNKEKNIRFDYDYSKIVDFLQSNGCTQDFSNAKKVKTYKLPNIKNLAFHINEVNLTKQKNHEYAINGFFALETVYQAYNMPNFFHIVENDVLFSKKCFSISEKIVQTQDMVGCVQSGRWVKTKLFSTNKIDIGDGILIQDSDGSGTQHMCVTKTFIEEFRKADMFFKKDYGNSFDWVSHHFIHSHKLRVVNFSNKSLYFHFGIDSSIKSNFNNTISYNPDFSQIKVFGLD